MIVGAGFGGLSAALTLARQGHQPVLLERINYPGGCASTFTRDGYQFESGATLFSGFGPGQLFERWQQELGLGVELDWLDPVVELRTQGFKLPISSRRDALIETLKSMPGAPTHELSEFFRFQKNVADLLWTVLDDPGLLPPFRTRSLLSKLPKLAASVGLVGWLGKPLDSVLAYFGLSRFEPLRVILDAVSQITVQASSRDAEALIALATADYFFRGTCHVRHGIGTLAHALVDGIESQGGRVVYKTRVKFIDREGPIWRVHTNRGVIETPAVVANLLPQALSAMCSDETVQKKLEPHVQLVKDGWGACMLYRVIRDHEGLKAAPHHVQLIGDSARPFLEGNHIFCSVSGRHEIHRGPANTRVMTVSTHVPITALRDHPPAERASYTDIVQATMRQTLAERAPELSEGLIHELPASPRTFERFTGRPEGLVGGVPRKAGWHNYRHLAPLQAAPGLVLAGDSVFPGQSTLAVSLGGIKAAETVSSRCRRVKVQAALTD